MASNGIHSRGLDAITINHAHFSIQHIDSHMAFSVLSILKGDNLTGVFSWCIVSGCQRTFHILQGCYTIQKVFRLDGFFIPRRLIAKLTVQCVARLNGSLLTDKGHRWPSKLEIIV